MRTNGAFFQEAFAAEVRRIVVECGDPEGFGAPVGTCV
jgi:hypothetical protein